MTGRRALVTGVVGGIGAAIAARLAAEGAGVTVSDLPGAALDERAAALGLPAIAADLSDPAAVATLATQLNDGSGGPAILVSAAGGVCGQTGQPLEAVTPSDWHAIFRANIDSAFFLAQALAPAMKAAGWGRMVFIASGAGLRPSLTGIQAYTAAKHALVGLTKQLSQELGPHGITVNAIAPGLILSNPATHRQWECYGADGQAAILGRLHTRRLGKAEEIAAAAAFLTSEEAGWITAQILAVDGGMS